MTPIQTLLGAFVFVRICDPMSMGLNYLYLTLAPLVGHPELFGNFDKFIKAEGLEGL